MAVKTNERRVQEIITSIATKEGEGFSIRRPFPTRERSYIDPFLLLDHMEPVELGPGEAKGAPHHPHRGFETVTYMLEGKMIHEDSAGHGGEIGPGDVQWMTAGRGVIHSEMPSPFLFEKGGRLHGFQLWVNLPADKKMMAPRYQEIKSAAIPEAVSADCKVSAKVIAGTLFGVTAQIDTVIPITYLHLRLQPGAAVQIPVTEGDTAFAYVIEGTGTFGGESQQSTAGADQLVLFENAGDIATISNAAASGELSVLFLAGKPLNEPVARYGPFVMNTPAQIEQAVRDYQNGSLA